VAEYRRSKGACLHVWLLHVDVVHELVVRFRRSGLRKLNWPQKLTPETDEHDAFVRDSCSTAPPCRQSGLSVSGRQSTAAETHENDAVILYYVLTSAFDAVSGFEVSFTERRWAVPRGVARASGFVERLFVPAPRRHAAETNNPWTRY
jgi:hypothetical protein